MGSPSAENDEMCAGNGSDNDKLFCFGANTDETCSRVNASLPLTDNFECTNCWAGVTADLYYKISTVLGVPTKAEVGVRNTKITGALQVRAHGDTATELTSGSFDLFAPEVHFNFMAGSIPLNFTLSLPLRIDYSLGLKGQLDANAGAVLDVDFGDHAVSISPLVSLRKLCWKITPPHCPLNFALREMWMSLLIRKLKPTKWCSARSCPCTTTALRKSLTSTKIRLC